MPVCILWQSDICISPQILDGVQSSTLPHLWGHTYFYSTVWIMKVIIGFKTKNHVFQCLQISLFANKFYSMNTYIYSPVWIMMVYNNFDAQNVLLICLQISHQIFAILQNFAINNLRDQQFCTPLCELERSVVVLFTSSLASHLRLRSRQAWCEILPIFSILYKLLSLNSAFAYYLWTPFTQCLISIIILVKQ